MKSGSTSFHRRSGFTLIELLVVIALIGILASVILVNLNRSRNRARDTGRIKSMTSVRTALELYSDTFGQYPPTGGTWRNECNYQSV